MFDADLDEKKNDNAYAFPKANFNPIKLYTQGEH